MVWQCTGRTAGHGASRAAAATWLYSAAPKTDPNQGDTGVSHRRFAASGNSENEAANAALEVKNTRDKWTHTFGLTGNYGSDGSVTNSERREVRGQSDHAFTDHAYRSARGLILRGDIGFQHQRTDATKIVDRFLIESNSDNTCMQNDLGLEVTITGSLGLRLAYQVRHDTDVLRGAEKTDTLTTVGLIYETK